MSDKMDETKYIKRKIDDETVEQLVENRFAADNDNTAAHTHSSHRKSPKKKKKKNIGLNILITALAFVLVFVIFFLGSYIFFTATPLAPESETTDVQNEVVVPEEKPKDESKHFDSEIDEEAQNIIDNAAGDETEEDDKPVSAPLVTTKPQSTSKPQATTKPKAPSKPQSTVKKEENKTADNDETDSEKKNNSSQNTDNKDKGTVSTDKNEPTNKTDSSSQSSSSTVVEKNENSEAIVFE